MLFSLRRTALRRAAAPLVVLGILPSMSVTLTAQTKPATRVRAEIATEYKWDFSPIFPDWDAWETAMRETEAQMDAFAALKGTLAQGPEAVLRAYKLYDDVGIRQYRIYRYPQLQRDVDLRNQDISARFQRVQALFAKFGTATAWFTPELLTIPEKTMHGWLDATPALDDYRFTILDAYRQAAHTLDESGERLLSYASRFNDSPKSAYQELSTSDIQFPTVKLHDGREVTLTPGAYQQVLSTNYDQGDRATAFTAYLQNYERTRNTYAALYNGILQRDWFHAQARHYDTTVAAALDGNAIPVAVLENLVQTVRAGTAPLQRYLRLRKRILGLDTYHLYDGSVPLFRDDTVYPYDSARALVISSVAPLGADYQAKLTSLFDGGRIDVYENEGKRSGAYNASVYGVGPYVLMNYNDTLDAVFTMAHELGHAMHSRLAEETQPFVNASYTIFVAEVASTTNERFLLDQLLSQTADPKQRFLLLQHAVNAIVGTFYTQVLFADFELQAHQRAERGEPITSEVLCDIYGKLLQDYYGDAITPDELYRYTWARIPHFYNSPYYVYQYATCFASSAQLYRAMTHGSARDKAAATERYLTLLHAGGSDYPMELLKHAGVDLTTKAPIEAVIAQMDDLVAHMEAEAARIEAGK